MAETIEDFVAKIQAEGVQAGEKAAEELISKAREEAEKILADAQTQAEKIAAEAEKKAQGTLARSKNELELASRDAVLRLRQVLGKAMEAVLTQGVQEQLKDAEFLRDVLKELMVLYAQADIERKPVVKINIAPETREKLEHWALEELKNTSKDRKVSLDLKANLEQAGFVYNVSGANVEFTVDSVVGALSELVGPRLKGILDKAAGEKGA